MQPIRTEQRVIEDGLVRFIVRKVSSLERKQRAGAPGGTADPFLPHEPDLFVAEVSDTHLALLNKFNVLDRHLLLVTRAFAEQERLPDAHDFEALAACMADFDSLAFYNGGALAGASQAHKHFQLVPLPLAPGGPAVPMEALFAAVSGKDGVVHVPGLAFSHAFAWMAWQEAGSANALGARLLALCDQMLAATGCGGRTAGGYQSAPYNLLLTRRWMLLVPRSREHFDSISVNALGFAGSLFVRNETQMNLVAKAGPMTLLKAVAVP